MHLLEGFQSQLYDGCDHSVGMFQELSLLTDATVSNIGRIELTVLDDGIFLTSPAVGAWPPKESQACQLLVTTLKVLKPALTACPQMVPRSLLRLKRGWCKPLGLDKIKSNVSHSS